jgi:hypothetical protein
VQVAAGVTEHKPRRRLARGAWNGNRGDCPATNTVSKRSIAALSLAPC